MTYRAIVCGCRDWSDEIAVDHELTELLNVHEQFTIVHGACPTGADNIARIWGTALDLEDAVTVEEHPADWAKHGKAAGPIRNSEMANLGADICLAFWDGLSKGTLDMITKAVRCGILVRIIPRVKA